MNKNSEIESAKSAEVPDVSILDAINWIIGKGPHCADLTELLEGFCDYLRQLNIPLDRATIGVPLLHPIAQSSYVAWNPEEGAEQNWFLWTKESMARLHASPIYIVYNEGKNVAIDLSDEKDRGRFPVGKDLWEQGFQAYHALAVPFSDGSSKVLTVATRKVGGFTSTEVTTIKSLVPALAIVFEGFVSRKTSETLMETYVGQRAGLKVLDGHIARGDGSHINAVIWFSDLRRFTELAAGLPENEMMDLLNEYFTLVTESIEDNGGEVLKYIGDAVLAIFPDDNGMARAVTNAENAALESLKVHENLEAGFEFGIALHPGKVFYGNIGGGSRLDFTVIGQAVNVASRIEGLCSQLSARLLVSGAFADQSEREWKSLGSHDLKGVDKPVEVFGVSDI